MSAHAARRTILVVDDDAGMRELIDVHLRNAGYAVRTAEDGLQGAAFCLTAAPDLVISDVHMPHMSGLELIEILKGQPDMSRIPFIFLTGSDSALERSRELGAAEYLTKPIEVDELLSAVARHLPVPAE